MFLEEIAFLKQLIVDLDLIKSNQTLKTGKWNKSSYELLSKIIYRKLDSTLSLKEKMDLGVTLSPRTLYNFFEGKRVIRKPFDKRVIRTLNKLARFVDLKDWDGVIEKKDKRLGESNNGKLGEKKELVRFLERIKDEEFELYRSLNKAALSKLKKRYTSKSSAFKEIAHNFRLFKNSGWTMTNSYNPSSFSFVDIKPKNNKNHKGSFLVSTTEYWILCWFDNDKKKYVKRYKNLSKHIYTIIKDESDEFMIDMDATESLKF